jgi:hypothetical protein
MLLGPETPGIGPVLRTRGAECPGICPEYPDVEHPNPRFQNLEICPWKSNKI